MFTIRTLKTLFLLTLLSACQPSEQVPEQQWRHAIEGAYAANISNDGKYSVVSSIHHGVSLWDLDKNALKYSWSQQQNSTDNLVLLADIADNNSHALIANRNDFSLWNIDNGKSEGFWSISESNIRDIAVANNGNYLLVGQSNGKVVHITPDNGRRLEFLGHQEKINAVDIMPNGRVAISGSNDFVAYVWDTQSGQVIYRFNHPSRVTMVALDPKGRYAFTADSKKSANIWNLKTGKLVSQLKYFNRQEVFSTVRFSPDGTTLLTGAPSRKVSIWAISTGERLTSWRVTPREDIRPAGAVVYSAAFRDNERVITESSSGYAELWQVNK
ncbi:WD40 repeat domain-containing protein [Cognaticolwellia mytili]|uniref:WD40 repeat domain-containing protein n=1 Tax=Cognaticolwellia mytili TaxID=1888913 RepID=UPI0038B3B295